MSELSLSFLFSLKRNEKFSKENLNEHVLSFYSAFVYEDNFLSGCLIMAESTVSIFPVFPCFKG